MDKNGEKKCVERKYVGKIVKPVTDVRWALQVTFFTFVMAVCCSFLSQVATRGSDIIIAFMLLIFMILVSIIFDGIGISAAACNLAELNAAFKDYRSPVYRTARWIIRNAEKVNNFCSDVVGDMCGILSGACGATITMKLASSDVHLSLIATVISSIIAALTVGGKAFLKGVAVNNCTEFVVLSAKAMNLFKLNRRILKNKPSKTRRKEHVDT